MKSILISNLPKSKILGESRINSSFMANKIGILFTHISTPSHSELGL